MNAGFLLRTAQVVLTWDLRRQEQDGALLLPALFLLLVLLSVLLYLGVSLMDPGFVLSDTEAELFVGLSQEQQEMNQQLLSRRCGYCLLQQPMRARHCQTCRHCVRRFDHHCPWIHNCVGERNHRWFVLYLAVQLLALLWGLHEAWSGFDQASSWDQWLRQNGFLLVASCVMATFSVVVLLLLGSHFFLVSLNVTTWEFMSRHRISYLKYRGAEENPFDRGTFRNLWGFFCIRRLVVWEEVYAKGGATFA